MDDVAKVAGWFGKLLCKIGLHDWNWCGDAPYACDRCAVRAHILENGDGN